MVEARGASRVRHRTGACGTITRLVKDKSLLGVAVQVLYRSDATRRANSRADDLRRAFGEAWEKVALILSVLFNAANLAEVARMASVQLRRLTGTAQKSVRFAVRHGSAEVTFEGLDVGAAGDSDERNLLQRIRVIAIDSITVTAPVTV